MDSMRSWGLVRRILLLSAVLGVLIVFEGAKPPRESQPAPRRSRPPAAAKKVPPPPAPPRHEREFPNFEGHKSGLSFAKDEVHVYLFDLEPDDFVDIEVEQKGVDVVANVYGPGEQPPVKVDRQNRESGPEDIPVLATAGGRYKVELTGDGGGTYQILVQQKRKAEPRDRKSAAGAQAYSLGLALMEKRKTEAEKAFQKALASWALSGYRAGQADAAYQLGKLFFYRGANREALSILEKALARYRELKNHQQEMAILSLLGLLHETFNDDEQALASFNGALALSYKLNDLKNEATILGNRGGLYSEVGEFGKALKDIETAMAIRRALQDQVLLADTLNVLGRAYYVQNELEKALSLHQESLGILKDHPGTLVEIQSLIHLGDVYRMKGNFQEATSLYLRALSLLQQGAGNPRFETTALNNLGLAYLEAGRYHDAFSAFRHCQRVFTAMGDTESVAKVWTNQGWVLASMKRYDEASGAFRQALSMSRGKKGSFLKVASYYGLAWSERQRGNLISAKEFIERSLSAMELIRARADRTELRALFLAGKQNLYDLLVEILMDQHWREPTKGFDIQAFEASERARSRTLLDQLEGRPVLPSLSVQDIQRQVLGTNDVVLLEYFMGDKRSYLWVVTSSSFASYELPAARAQIENLAREVHGLLGESNKVEKRRTAIRKSIELSRLLFGQVAGRLEGKKLLIVAPPKLQYISFRALPEDVHESVWKGNAWPRPWILNHEIIEELSATVLADLRRLNENHEPSPGLVAILADPVYSTVDERAGGDGTQWQSGSQPPFQRLRFSQSEVQAIEAAVGESRLSNAKQLAALGFDASRQRVLDGDLEKFRYLHFSAHGELDPRNTDRSAIVLSLIDSKGNPLDGFLRAGEIAKLELPADLVVLSACKTGLGREIRGEGLIGLTQAFFTSGAARVMVSLWDVDDQATASLMGRFYHNLLHDHLSPAAALREAQAWMWRQPRWNAPSYWGGFVLQGEWN